MTTSLIPDIAIDLDIHEGPGNRRVAAEAVRCTCRGASTALPRCKESTDPSGGMCWMCLDHCAPLSKRVVPMPAPRRSR